MATDDPESLAPIELPIDGVLDLHTFAPADVQEFVAGYLRECAQRGIQQVRIIHGKGQGMLRRIDHGVLQRHPRVHAYVFADLSGGGPGSHGCAAAHLRSSCYGTRDSYRSARRPTGSSHTGLWAEGQRHHPKVRVGVAAEAGVDEQVAAQMLHQRGATAASPLVLVTSALRAGVGNRAK